MNTRWQVTAGRLTQEIAEETDRAQQRYEAALRAQERGEARSEVWVTATRLEVQRLRSVLAKARALLDGLVSL